MESPSIDRVREEMNALLLHELACVSLYELAVAELGDAEPDVREELEEIARAHCRNSRTLREEVLRLGGTPALPVGDDWLVAEPTPASDPAAVLAALAAGEENAIRRYDDAARRLPGACRALVLEVLLPARRRNLLALKALEKAAPGHGDCTPVPSGEGVHTSPATKEVTL